MSRKLAREELFKLVFRSELLEEELQESSENYLKANENSLKEEEIEFLKNYIEGISKHNSEIVEILKRNTTGWSLERVGTVERVLLKISTYETVFENFPIEISINEAIELAKKYGDEKSHEFINGVLAKVVVDNNR